MLLKTNPVDFPQAGERHVGSRNVARDVSFSWRVYRFVSAMHFAANLIIVTSVVARFSHETG